MTVRKFRSVEEMNQPTWRRPGDPDLYRAIAALWELGSRTGVHRFTPGVRKYRSVEEMRRATEAQQEANFREYQRSLAARREEPA